MPEIGPSGSMSGEWKRSESRRATPRLYSPPTSPFLPRHPGGMSADTGFPPLVYATGSFFGPSRRFLVAGEFFFQASVPRY